MIFLSWQAKEGAIEEGSAMWQEMSKGDQEKRSRASREKSTKLRSPNFYISTTRLSLRNLPYTMNEKALKTLVVAAVRSSLVSPNPCRPYLYTANLDGVKYGLSCAWCYGGSVFVATIDVCEATMMGRIARNCDIVEANQDLETDGLPEMQVKERASKAVPHVKQVRNLLSFVLSASGAIWSPC
jgi:hypothetical protein